MHKRAIVKRLMTYLDLKTLDMPDSESKLVYHVDKDRFAYSLYSHEYDINSDEAIQYAPYIVDDEDYEKMEKILTERGLKSIINMEALEEKKRLIKKLHYYSGISTHLT